MGSELAKVGTSLIAINSVEKLRLRLAFNKTVNTRWLNERTYDVTGQFWPVLGAKRSKNLILLGRLTINKTTCILIGYIHRSSWQTN